MRFGTRWRFILPTVMVLCFIGTLGYFEVKERTTRADRIRQQKAHDDKEMVFYIPDESDVVRDGLVILQTIGLIPMLLITDDPFSSNQQWWPVSCSKRPRRTGSAMLAAHLCLLSGRCWRAWCRRGELAGRIRRWC